MKRREDLAKKVLRFTREHSLFSPNEPVVVGVSGGPDSVCLIHILAGLRRTLRTRLHIAHLNHSLRGTESDEDADYVNLLARELKVPATIEKLDVRAYQKKHRLSLEEAAREVRYTFFAGVARSIGTDTVAVGHTADDQVETVLMNLVRGTGLAGLRGMQPLSIRRQPGTAQLRIVRPLLETGRGGTEAYCAAQGLSPRIDSSNLLPDQLRNRLRNQLLPLLRDYNPDVDNALLRIARTAGEDLTFIDLQVSLIWDSTVSERPQGLAVDRAGFAALHPAVKRHLVRSVLQRLLGDLKDIESVHVESIVKAMSGPAGKRISLPRELAFYSEYGCGLLSLKGAPTCPYPALKGEHRLKIPGETELPGWKVTGSIVDYRPEKGDGDGFEAHLDLDIVGNVLTVRGRKRGETFQPLGMDKDKKLQDFMVDAKIPRHWRDSVPLVCSPQHIVWVVGWRIDHRARVTPRPGRVLRLNFESAEQA